jgi:hypothetical protein
MENQELVISPKEFGLEENKVKDIELAFLPKIEERNQYAKMYVDLLSKELTPEICEEAKDLRKKLVKVRTGIAAIHTTQKSFFLAAGRFVDAWKNKETEPVQQMESKLSEIEDHFENIERERIARIYDQRVTELKPFGILGLPENLGIMDDNTYNLFLAIEKRNFEFEQEEIRKAESEKERLAEVEKLRWARSEMIKPYYQFFVDDGSVKLGEMPKEEFYELMNSLVEKHQAHQKQIEDQRLENERLKKEAEERNASIEATRKEQAVKEAQIQAENNARIEAERQMRVQAENELKARQEAEMQRLENEEKERQNELSKGDAAKVKDLIKYLEIAKTKFEFKSRKNNKMYEDVQVLIDKVINHIQK